MSPYIKFESIDCDLLRYERASNSWVCLRFYDDLDTAEYCMHCKFNLLDRIEKRIKETLYRAKK